LQQNLVNWLNAHSEAFEAIQELRCIIPPYSPVPNIVAIAHDRLPDQDGPFHGAPDWLIEIRSPCLVLLHWTQTHPIAFARLGITADRPHWL